MDVPRDVDTMTYANVNLIRPAQKLSGDKLPSTVARPADCPGFHR